MAKKIRVGVAGCRWVGSMHTEALARTPGVELTALAELDEARRVEIVKQYGFRQSFPDWQTMILEAELDALVVALPTFMHGDACLGGLRAGLHVLCEKPPTSTAAEMTRVARVARDRELVYMFGRQSRFDPRVLAARKLVAGGKLGDVYHAEASWTRTRWGGLRTPSWRLERDRGGGVLLDLGVHAIDEAWFCMGCPKPVEVSAGLYAAFKHLSPRPSTYTADDAAAGMVRFEDGATLSFRVTFALNTPGPAGGPAAGRMCPEWGVTRIYGTKAGLDVKSGLLVRGGVNDVDIRPYPAPGKHPAFDAQVREFVRAVRTGDTPISSADHALWLMKMLDAARRSGDEGRSVRVR